MVIIVYLPSLVLMFSSHPFDNMSKLAVCQYRCQSADEGADVRKKSNSYRNSCFAVHCAVSEDAGTSANNSRGLYTELVHLTRAGINPRFILCRPTLQRGVAPCLSSNRRRFLSAHSRESRQKTHNQHSQAQEPPLIHEAARAKRRAAIRTDMQKLNLYS